MKIWWTGWLCIWLSSQVCAQSPKRSSSIGRQSYEQFRASLTSLSDTARIRRLCQYGQQAAGETRFTDAQSAFTEALNLAKQTGSRRQIRTVYLRWGNARFAEGKYPEAIAAYQQAEAYSVGAERYETWADMGIVYLQALDYNRAEAYLKRVLAARSPAASPEEQATANLNLGGLADERHQAAKAIAYYQRVMAYYKTRNDWNRYYSVVMNAAISYSDLKQYAYAIDLFEQCLRYADRIEHDKAATPFSANNFRTTAYANLPYPLIGLRQFDAAERYAQQALVLARQDVGQVNHLMWIYDALTLLYEKKGDYRRALEAHKQWAVYRDSTQNQARTQKFAEQEARYQNREKEAEIRRLDKDNTVKNRQLVAGFGGMALLLLLSGTLAWQYRRIQRSQTRIQQQSNQMALMMRELHHRVKNNLAIVSSLLRLQSNRLDDENAVQAVRTSQQRVEAMSLIHQRLYQTEQVTTVDIGDYLTDLARSLQQAYGYESDEFDLILDVEQQELDVDLALPLGLVANELITNAFKYAYTGACRPMLRIALYQNRGLTLEVEDNGPGLTTTDWNRAGSRSSFGKRLVRSLTDQLNGELEVASRQGTLFRLHIPESRLNVA